MTSKIIENFDRDKEYLANVAIQDAWEKCLRYKGRKKTWALKNLETLNEVSQENLAQLGALILIEKENIK